ncbi:hypothetical protein RA210_U30193 [Rubrivivax sp. A210]|nr:hypothetical protein RA210_U30193 [Rubrivivax sp. A210]
MKAALQFGLGAADTDDKNRKRVRGPSHGYPSGGHLYGVPDHDCSRNVQHRPVRGAPATLVGRSAQAGPGPGQRRTRAQ